MPERGDIDLQAFQRDCEERLQRGSMAPRLLPPAPPSEQLVMSAPQQAISPACWAPQWCSDVRPVMSLNWQPSLIATPVVFVKQEAHAAPYEFDMCPPASSPPDMGSNSSDTQCTVPDTFNMLSSATSAGLHLHPYGVVPQQLTPPAFLCMPPMAALLGMPALPQLLLPPVFLGSGGESPSEMPTDVFASAVTIKPDH